MADEAPPDLQRQLDALAKAMAANTDKIDALSRRADASDMRADAASVRVDSIEAQGRLDREILAELQADGVLNREHVANLEAALVASRTIGAALGILMARRNVGLEQALSVLKDASQRSNTKMRDLAATIVAGADAIK